MGTLVKKNHNSFLETALRCIQILQDGFREFKELADPNCKVCHGEGLCVTDGTIETGASRWCHAHSWKAKVTDLCSCVDRTKLSRSGLNIATSFLPHKRWV